MSLGCTCNVLLDEAQVGGSPWACEPDEHEGHFGGEEQVRTLMRWYLRAASLYCDVDRHKDTKTPSSEE